VTHQQLPMNGTRAACVDEYGDLHLARIRRVFR
jgi:hypothetical protein